MLPTNTHWHQQQLPLGHHLPKSQGSPVQKAACLEVTFGWGRLPPAPIPARTPLPSALSVRTALGTAPAPSRTLLTGSDLRGPTQPGLWDGPQCEARAASMGRAASTCLVFDQGMAETQASQVGSQLS